MLAAVPRVKAGTVRGVVLLWVCTDRPRTWTTASMIAELADMGTAPQTTIAAISALRARGLLWTGDTSHRDFDYLKPTEHGRAAINLNAEFGTKKGTK